MYRELRYFRILDNTKKLVGELIVVTIRESIFVQSIVK